MIKKILTLITFIALLIGGLSEAKISHSYDVRTSSTVTASEIDSHLKGVLAGKGKCFKDAEQKYHVNAVFLVAIAIFESGNGTSAMARRRNNCFGLLGRRFKSVEECIDYTAKLISSEKGCYYGRRRYTIHGISRIYAPTWHHPGNRRWPSSVVAIMNKIEI